MVVWVHLLDLQFNYWDRELICEIGAIVGQQEILREAFAWFCVEIDVPKPLVPGASFGSKDNFD